jgi:hypothetical protein
MSFSLPTTTSTSPSLMTKSADGTIWNLSEMISRMAMTSMWYRLLSCSSAMVFPRKLFGGAISTIMYSSESGK